MFKRLKISDWRQFSNVDISFHPHLTVLTGANGAGKPPSLICYLKVQVGTHNL